MIGWGLCMELELGEWAWPVVQATLCVFEACWARGLALRIKLGSVWGSISSSAVMGVAGVLFSSSRPPREPGWLRPHEPFTWGAS